MSTLRVYSIKSRGNSIHFVYLSLLWDVYKRQVHTWWKTVQNWQLEYKGLHIFVINFECILSIKVGFLPIVNGLLGGRTNRWKSWAPCYSRNEKPPLTADTSCIAQRRRMRKARRTATLNILRIPQVSAANHQNRRTPDAPVIRPWRSSQKKTFSLFTFTTPHSILSLINLR